MAQTGGGWTRFGRLSELPGACPITWAVLAANAVTFLTTSVLASLTWSELTFRTFIFPAQLWSAFTYPLVASGDILWLLLGGYMFWLFGGSLERSWGTRDYLVFLSLVTGTTAISVWIGTLLVGPGVILAGLWLLLAAMIVAWSTINPFERLLVYFVIPLQARWLGIIVLALVFFSFRPFPLGLFALGGCGVAWWYARGGKYRLWEITGGRAIPLRPGARLRENQSPRSPLELFRRWRRKRQFMRLVKRSKLRDIDS